jgi:alkaline phosphatase D
VKAALALLACGFTAACAFAGPVAPLTRIAFGSCNRQDLDQPLWKPILAWQPQLWIWLGDTIYGDSADPAVLAAKWRRQKADPGYKKLAARVPILGTWDDHDYGQNDGGARFPARADSQRLILDFLGEPADSPRRKQRGIYTSVTLGPPGRQVCVVLLDARYFREAPGTGGDILGKAQWKWLERTLRTSRAQVHLICSGTQIIPTEHVHEKWADYPSSRSRLFALIGKYRVPGVVLLSGDRHFGEIARLADSAAGQPVCELTSSGLTHFWKNFPGEPNRHRVGAVFDALNFGTIEIDWGRSLMKLQLRGASGRVAREVAHDFSSKKP